MKVLIIPELTSLYSSGGLKSLLSSMQLLVETSSGAFRPPKARGKNLVELVELVRSEINAFLHATLDRVAMLSSLEVLMQLNCLASTALEV